MLKIVYTHLYNIFVSLLLKCGLDLSRRRNFISENMATCSLIATGLIFYDLRQRQLNQDQIQIQTDLWSEALHPSYLVIWSAFTRACRAAGHLSSDVGFFFFRIRPGMLQLVSIWCIFVP